MAHTPVLLKEAIESLNVKKGGLYIDATFGEGGYSSEIIARGGKVLALDLDRDQIEKAKKTKKMPEAIFAEGNFARIEKIAVEKNYFPVDGVIFDLGLSWEQIDSSGRGFSYKRPNEELDMRLDQEKGEKAWEILFRLSENDLYELFAKNSEEIYSKEIAKEIKRSKKIVYVKDLIIAIDRALKRKNDKVYARIFQALRIAVNNDFENLRFGLLGASRLIKKDGRIVVLSFHSLEDRLVKNFGRLNKMKSIHVSVDRKRHVRGFERSAKIRILYYE